MTPTAAQAIAVADAARLLTRATVSATRTQQGLPALPEAQVAVLHALRAHPGMTPAELAQQQGLARPTVSNLLRDLEAAGLVARTRSELDGRSVLLSITEEARQVQDAFRRGRAEVLSAAWGELDRSDRNALTAASPALRRLADLLHTCTQQIPSEDAVSPQPRRS